VDPNVTVGALWHVKGTKAIVPPGKSSDAMAGSSSLVLAKGPEGPAKWPVPVVSSDGHIKAFVWITAWSYLKRGTQFLRGSFGVGLDGVEVMAGGAPFP
jgi:hypothetical protein